MDNEQFKARQVESNDHPEVLTITRNFETVKQPSESTALRPATSGGAVAPSSMYEYALDTRERLGLVSKRAAKALWWTLPYIRESKYGPILNFFPVLNGLSALSTVFPRQYGNASDYNASDYNESDDYRINTDLYGSHNIMSGISEYGLTGDISKLKIRLTNPSHTVYLSPQDTYLLNTREDQRRVFENNGYTYIEPVNDELYGFVKSSAVKLGEKRGERLPIYQQNPSVISRDKVIPLHNSTFYYKTGNHNYATPKILDNSGDAYTQLYYDPETHLVYFQQWDLNDYGTTSNKIGTNWFNSNFLSRGQDVLDMIGLPTVTYSGI